MCRRRQEKFQRAAGAPRSTEYSSRPFLRSPRPISDDSTTMIREDRLGGTGVSASLNLRRPVSPPCMTITSVSCEPFRWISTNRGERTTRIYTGRRRSTRIHTKNLPPTITRRFSLRCCCVSSSDGCLKDRSTSRALNEKRRTAIVQTSESIAGTISIQRVLAIRANSLPTPSPKGLVSRC